MKNFDIHFSKTRLALILLSVFAILSFTENPFELKKLTAETNHSTLMFSVPIASGITRITGKYNDYIIDLDYVDGDFTKSALRATIQAASIDTGIDGRDEHLRSADFFDTETYPEITFESERIEKAEEGYVAHGNFSMHGVTKKIALPFVVTGIDGENTIGISSRLSINRIEYGVGADWKHSSMENFVGEIISVEIDFWTKKRKEKKN